jgi:hypothetical protein
MRDRKNVHHHSKYILNKHKCLTTTTTTTATKHRVQFIEVCQSFDFSMRTRLSGKLQAHVFGGSLHSLQTGIHSQFVLVHHLFKFFSSTAKRGGGDTRGSGGDTRGSGGVGRPPPQSNS